jgi:hypothetical protein
MGQWPSIKQKKITIEMARFLDLSYHLNSHLNEYTCSFSSDMNLWGKGRLWGENRFHVGDQRNNPISCQLGEKDPSVCPFQNLFRLLKTYWCNLITCTKCSCAYPWHFQFNDFCQSYCPLMTFILHYFSYNTIAIWIKCYRIDQYLKFLSRLISFLIEWFLAEIWLLNKRMFGL